MRQLFSLLKLFLKIVKIYINTIRMDKKRGKWIPSKKAKINNEYVSTYLKNGEGEKHVKIGKKYIPLKQYKTLVKQSGGGKNGGLYERFKLTILKFKLIRQTNTIKGYIETIKKKMKEIHDRVTSDDLNGFNFHKQYIKYKEYIKTLESELTKARNLSQNANKIIIKNIKAIISMTTDDEKKGVLQELVNELKYINYDIVYHKDKDIPEKTYTIKSIEEEFPVQILYNAYAMPKSSRKHEPSQWGSVDECLDYLFTTNVLSFNQIIDLGFRRSSITNPNVLAIIEWMIFLKVEVHKLIKITNIGKLEEQDNVPEYYPIYVQYDDNVPHDDDETDSTINQIMKYVPKQEFEGSLQEEFEGSLQEEFEGSLQEEFEGSLREGGKLKMKAPNKTSNPKSNSKINPKQTQYRRTDEKISVKTEECKTRRLTVYKKGERGIRYYKDGTEYKLCSEIEKTNKKREMGTTKKKKEETKRIR